MSRAPKNVPGVSKGLSGCARRHRQVVKGLRQVRIGGKEGQRVIRVVERFTVPIEGSSAVGVEYLYKVLSEIERAELGNIVLKNRVSVCVRVDLNLAG